MGGYNFDGMTAEDCRAEARRCRERSAESWERSDTDGFLSQKANDVNAQVYEIQADLIERGGVAIFPALFDLEGNQVPAIRELNQYDNWSWRLLDPDAPNTRRTLGWFHESNARKPGAARSNDAKKGFYVGRAMAPAEASTNGNRSTFWATVVKIDEDRYTSGEAIDNGVGATNLEEHYKIKES
jgi:hypothetical protein